MTLKFFCPVHKLMFVCDSHCCDKPPLAAVTLSNGSQKIAPYDCMKLLWDKGLDFHATTITIGCRKYGKLSADEQYKRMVKDIRVHMKRYNFNDDKYYYYCFELQKNGQLHAHGIEINTYNTPFQEIFSDWGARNNHPESFKKVSSFEEYYKYITKECEYPTITNFSKRNMRRIITLAQSPKSGD